MYDMKWIRENPEDFDNGLKRRRAEPASVRVLALDEERRAAQTRLNELQAERNETSKKIGMAKKAGEDAQGLIDAVAAMKSEMSRVEEHARRLGEELDGILASLPNTPDTDVPDGDGDQDNVEVRRHGEPKDLGFAPKEHFDLGEALGLMDFEGAAKLSGARFVVLKGALARLERALGQFMLDLQTEEHGYSETNTPVLVRDAALFGTGQLPKFKEDLFTIPEYPSSRDDLINRIDRGNAMDLARDLLNAVVKADMDTEEAKEEMAASLTRLIKAVDHLAPARRWLIPTAEVTLTNLYAGELLDEKDLPIRMTAFTQCFRSEAGAAGKDTRGMIRQHQFEKVELVSIVHPDESNAELERKTGCAEEVLKRLDIPYRVMALCTGDMGFSARKTYDIEVWLPGQGKYREISSISNCGDFQARRMNARFRPKGEAKGTRFVHTLNGSGLAVGRTLIAVLETYQNADGSITVPDVLKPYMGGLEVIGADV